MPFALLIVGAFLLIAAARGTTDGPDGLFMLIAGEFTGPASFAYWMVAILLIGALGYFPKAKPVSVAMLGLIIVVLFLSKGDPSKAGGGFFEKFTAGLATTTTAKPTAAANNVSNATAGAAAGTLAPGSPGTQSLIQQSIQTLPNAAQVSPLMNGGINAVGSLANQFEQFGSDVSGWIN